jgi:hypothetical protein
MSCFGYLFSIITTITTITFSILMVIPYYPFTVTNNTLASILIVLSIVGFIPLMGYVLGCFIGLIFISIFALISNIIECCHNEKINTPKFKIVKIEKSPLMNNYKKPIYQIV